MKVRDREQEHIYCVASCSCGRVDIYIYIYNEIKRKKIQFFSSIMNLCNIMTEGFRFMPLGFVRLGTFQLSA